MVHTTFNRSIAKKINKINFINLYNSKTWIKLNQIDCESRFNLNLLRKSFIAMTFLSYYYM